MGTPKHQPSKQLSPNPKKFTIGSTTIIAIVITLVAITIGIFFYPTTNNNTPTSSHQYPPQPTSSKLPQSYYNAFYQHRLTPSHESPFHSVTPLTKEKWSFDQPFQANLLTSQRPRVLINTTATQWPAFTSTDPAHKWDLNSNEWRRYIGKIMMVNGISTMETPYYGPTFRNSNKPLLKSHPNIQLDDFNPVVNLKRVKIDDFFDHIVQNDDEESLSSSKQQLSSPWIFHGNLNTPHLLRDIKPYNELLPTSHDNTMSIQIEEKGIMTHPKSQNLEQFVVQIQGQRRFTLWSPDQSDYSYLYPYLHPAAGQTQPIVHPSVMKISSEGSEEQIINRFPNVSKIKAIEVILNPTELLYIPSNWFYQIETISPSVGISMGSRSQAVDQFESALRLLMDNMIHEWQSQQRRLAIAFLIQSILAHHEMRDGIKVWDDERDLDPFQLKELFKKQREMLSEKKNNATDASNTFDDANNNKEEDEDAIWIAFVKDNVPLGSSTLSSLSFDDYTLKFFSRYLDSRYSNLFKSSLYFHDTTGSHAHFHLFEKNDNNENNKDTSSFDQPPLDQTQLRQQCNFAQDLTIPDLSYEKYMRIYQGGGLLGKREYQHFIKSIDQSIPNEAYVDLLFHLGQMIVNQLKHIQPALRPTYFANLIELWAKWASQESGIDTPSLIYCFKHVEIVLK